MSSPSRAISRKEADLFTGIIEELGSIGLIEGGETGTRLTIRCRTVLSDAAIGSSIAVNGVCLTVTALSPDSFSADLAPETLRRTNLGKVVLGSLVNLERPMILNARLSGHMVQGHVDGTGELISLEPLGDDNWWLLVRVPPELDRYLVFKGSIALDGISLTIAGIDGCILSAAIIPHTYCNTTFSARLPGDRVNLECDPLAKHVEKLMGSLLPR